MSPASEPEELVIYREMMSHLEDVIFSHDPEGRLLYLSPGWARVLGFDADEPGPQSFAEVLAPEFVEEAVRRTEQQMRGESPPQPWDLQAIDRHGQRLWVQIRTRPIYDPAGRLIKVVGVARDIHEKKLLEAKLKQHTEQLESLVEQRTQTLRESEERFRELAELLPETVFELDTKGRVLFTNRAGLETFGLTAEDLRRGITVYELMALEERQGLVDAGRRIMAGQHGGLREHMARRRDGALFPIMSRTAPVFRHGKVEGMRGIIVDLTERKQLEEQMQHAHKMEAIGTLAGGIAHDFNNLLMAIGGHVELLKLDSGCSAAQRERLGEIEEQVASAASLTQQLLGFARGGRYTPEPIELGAVVDKTVRMFWRTRAEIRVHVDHEPALAPIAADRGQIEQVLLNLYVNAWQAMPEGGEIFLATRSVTLAEERADALSLPAGRYALLTVRDTGIGMDAATCQRIFEPFFTTKERGRGTGLGLASVYGIMRNHGGSVSVTSAEGLGTTFSLYLPAERQPAPAAEAVLDAPRADVATILLVDDEPMIRDVARQMLAALGYRALVASSGREACALLGRAERVDLVILDLVMPGMDGGETFDRIRAIDPGVPIVLSSGYGDDELAATLATRGALGFLQKPYALEELGRRLHAILDRR